LNDTREDNCSGRNVQSRIDISKVFGKWNCIIASKSENRSRALEMQSDNRKELNTSVRRAFNPLKPVIQKSVVRTHVAA